MRKYSVFAIILAVFAIGALVLLYGYGYIGNKTPAPAATPAAPTEQAATTTPAAAPATAKPAIATATSTQAPAPVYKPTTVISTELNVANIVALTNNERIAHGALPLRENAKLDAAAALKLRDMEANNYFAHVSPTGVNPWQWIVNAGYAYTWAGENLAEGFPTAQATVTAWIASPTHEANIVKPQYQETGVATDGNLTVQEFAAPAK